MNNQIAHSRLLEMLSYDPATGLFIWIVPRRGHAPGAVAGWISHGYRQIRIEQIDYPAHRLAWFYVYGKWPEEQIDHINCQRSDNRMANLRNATQRQNKYNSRRRSDNTSGFKGVRLDKRDMRWSAEARIGGRRTHLGRFATAEAAHAAYAAAVRKHFGEFARPE